MEHEASVRLIFFISVFAVMAYFEVRTPRRVLTSSKPRRWVNNIAVTFLNTLLLRVLFPMTAVGTALYAADRGLGLFNNVPLPPLFASVAAVVLLDLLIYGQHVAFHLVQPLWRLHMMHHADLDIDVTTGARFHPVEILLSMVIKMAAVTFLGAPAWSVVAFEVILNGTAMFNHSNVLLPLGADRIVRRLIVTPDMHRVHHSVIVREMNSNYGFSFSVWDRWFNTYNDQPVKGHEGMMIGLANYRDANRLTLPHMIAMPLTARRLH